MTFKEEIWDYGRKITPKRRRKKDPRIETVVGVLMDCRVDSEDPYEQIAGEILQALDATKR